MLVGDRGVFRDNKQHCLVVYDDLSKHAVAIDKCRYVTKTTGREAYPGDVLIYILDH